MAKTGTKRNSIDPLFVKVSRAYKRVMELESIVDNFADAMRIADEDYIAMRGGLTPRMHAIWEQYVEWARSK